jgi:hypothetical protein
MIGVRFRGSLRGSHFLVKLYLAIGVGEERVVDVPHGEIEILRHFQLI